MVFATALHRHLYTFALRNKNRNKECLLIYNLPHALPPPLSLHGQRVGDRDLFFYGTDTTSHQRNVSFPIIRIPPCRTYARIHPRADIQPISGKANIQQCTLFRPLGIPIPLCSCGVIPTAMSLRKEGASKGAVASFLIATPQTGVDSIIATYSLMGLPFAIARPIIAFVTALFGGQMVNMADKDPSPALPREEEESQHNKHV